MQNLETRELMEEVFPLTDQVNLLSDTSRYAYDSLLTSQYLSYGTKSIAITDTNINTSKRHRESLRKQKSQGISQSGI